MEVLMKVQLNIKDIKSNQSTLLEVSAKRSDVSATITDQLVKLSPILLLKFPYLRIYCLAARHVILFCVHDIQL